MKNIIVNVKKTGADLNIGRHSIGQGGLSGEPMFDKQQHEVRNLKLKFIRLFVADWQKVVRGPGKFDWTLLDKNVKNILECGAEPIMCICFKPSFMYRVYTEKVVDPKDYGEWEELVYQMVKRYTPWGVNYWEVSNESDWGEAGGCPNLFTQGKYGYFYERTAKAVKKANPKAKVGGPALAFYTSKLLPEFLQYCKKNKVPLDFVSWHMYNQDPEAFKRSIIHVKNLLKANKLKCETSLNEWNLAFGGSLMQGLKYPEYQPCFLIETINNFLDTGLSHSCYYHLRNVNFRRKDVKGILSENAALETEYGVNYLFNLLGVFDHQGIMRPAYFSFKLLSRLLGKKLITKNPKGTVKLLATYNSYEDEINVLIWNFAVKRPKTEKINLKITGLKKGAYGYRRFLLDAKTTSNEEEKRLKVLKWEDTKKLTIFKDSFDLAPYGVTMIHLKFNKDNKMVLY